MAYESPVEDILYDLASWVQTGIGTYLTGIAAVKADGITLDTPVKFEVSDADPWGHTLYPICLVYPEEYQVESDYDSGHDEIMVTASLLVAISNRDPSKGTKIILRTVEAIRELVRDDRSMTNKVNLITTRRITYVPVDPDQPAIRVALISLELRKLVNRY